MVADVSSKGGGLDAFKPYGLLCDVSFDGVDGEEMDMAWAEVSLKATRQHTDLLKTASEVFKSELAHLRSKEEEEETSVGEEKKDDAGRGKQKVILPWKPHMSLAYDNPHGSLLTLGRAMEQVHRHPTLLTHDRKIKSVNLWKTEGKLTEWKKLDEILVS